MNWQPILYVDFNPAFVGYLSTPVPGNATLGGNEGKAVDFPYLTILL
jgi:hypothetical protein